jgi:hypothetical protein
MAEWGKAIEGAKREAVLSGAKQVLESERQSGARRLRAVSEGAEELSRVKCGKLEGKRMSNSEVDGVGLRVPGMKRLVQRLQPCGQRVVLPILKRHMSYSETQCCSVVRASPRTLDYSQKLV